LILSEVNGIRQDFYMELSPDGEVGIIDWA